MSGNTNAVTLIARPFSLGDDYSNESAFYQKVDRLLTRDITINVRDSTLEGGIACAKNKEILLDFNAIKKLNPDKEEFFASIKGLNFHELGHILFTHITYEQIFNKITKKTLASSQEIFQTFNILEDCRIENLLSSQYYTMRKYFSWCISNFILKDKNALDKTSTFLLTYGRKFLKPRIANLIEQRIKSKTSDEFKADIDEIKKLVDKYLLINNTNKQIKISILITELLKKNGTKSVSNTGKYIPSSSNTISPVEKNKTDNNKQAVKEFKKEIKEKKKEQEKQEKKEQKAKGKNQGNQKDSNDDKNPDSKGQETQNIQKNIQKLQDLEKEIQEELTDSKKETKKEINEDIEKDIEVVSRSEGIGTGYSDFDESFIGKLLEPSANEKIVSSNLVRIISKLRNGLQSSYVPNQKRGRLNIRAVINQGQRGQTDVFKRYQQSRLNKSKISVSLLLDSSGSMGRNEFDNLLKSAWCISTALDKTKDYVNVIEYSSDFRVLKNFFGRGCDWKRHFMGGTYVIDALKETIKSIKFIRNSKNVKSNIVILFTDGKFASTVQSEKEIKRLNALGALTVLVRPKNNNNSNETYSTKKQFDINSTEEIEGVVEELIKEHQLKLRKGRVA